MVAIKKRGMENRLLWIILFELVLHSHGQTGKRIPVDEVMDEFLYIPGMRMAEYNFWWPTDHAEECAKYCLEETRVFCQSFSYSSSAIGCGTYENARAGAPAGIYGRPLSDVADNGVVPSWGYYERKTPEYKLLEEKMLRLKNLTEIDMSEATELLTGFDSTLRAAKDTSEDEDGSGSIEASVSPGELELMSQMMELIAKLNPAADASPEVSESFASVIVNVSDSLIQPTNAKSWNALQEDPEAHGVAGIVMSSEIVGRDVSERLLFYSNSTSISKESENVGMWMDIVEDKDTTSGSFFSSLLQSFGVAEDTSKESVYVFPSQTTKTRDGPTREDTGVTGPTVESRDSILAGDVIIIPRKALRNRSVVTHFRYKGLSSVMPRRDVKEESEKIGTSLLVNSAVLTTSIHPKPPSEVFHEEPVVIIFEHHRAPRELDAVEGATEPPGEMDNSSVSTINDTEMNPVIEETLQCVYWEEGDGSTVSGWSTEGCVLETTNQTHTVCKCSHLTSFAVLLKMVDTSAEDEANSAHILALNWISYVGCFLSLVGVTIMCGAFIMLKFHTENMKIHFNLGVAVGMADLVFLFEELAQRSQHSCVFVTILLYYFNMAVLSWMLIEGLFLYSQVVIVFVTARRWVKYYVLAGWGVPAIVMGIAMGILNVQLGTNKACWLSPSDNSIWAFAAPAILVVFINFFILISVVKVIVSLQPGKNDNPKINKLKNAVKGSIFLSPLLGTTWLFGLLSLSHETLLFQYLFAATNSLQGFFLFVFHCLCNSEVRADFSRRHNLKMTSPSGSKASPWFSGIFGLNVATGLRKFRNSISFDFASSSHSSGNSEAMNSQTPDIIRQTKNQKLPTIEDADEDESTENKKPKLRRSQTNKSLPDHKTKRQKEKRSLSQSAIRVLRPDTVVEGPEATDSGKKKSLNMPAPLGMPMKNDVILPGKANRVFPMTHEQQMTLDKMLAEQMAKNEMDDKQCEKLGGSDTENDATPVEVTVEDMPPDVDEQNQNGGCLEATNAVEKAEKEAYKIPMSYDSGLNSIDNESLLDIELEDEFVEMPYGVYRVGIHGCDIVV